MEKLKAQPGSLKVTQCTILKQDITTATDILSLVDSITIFEDIFSPFITGKLILRDTLDFLNANGTLGPDLLKLRLQPPELDSKFWIDDVFVIYKVADRELVGNRVQNYTLFFASVELLRDIDSSISRKFQGSAMDVINKIASTYLLTTKKINSDESGSNVTYVSNFWNPSKNFSYIAEHACSSEFDSTFLFYENRDGFNFKTVTSLMHEDNKVIQSFVGSDYSGIVGAQDTASAGVVTKDLDLEYKNIQGIRIDMTYDFMKDYLDGGLITKLYSNDPVTKKIRWGTYSSLDTPTALNPHHLYPDSIVSILKPLIGSINRSYGMFGRAEYSNYAKVQKRTSILRKLQSSKVEIDVHGQTHYTVGRKVSLNLNQLRAITKADSDSSVLDRLYSGKYIITAISHQIKTDGYTCTIELSKESSLLA